MPYQTAAISEELRRACARAVHVVTPAGRTLRAGKAILFVLNGLGYRRMARILARAPLLWVVEAGYVVVATNRGRLGLLVRATTGR